MSSGLSALNINATEFKPALPAAATSTSASEPPDPHEAYQGSREAWNGVHGHIGVDDEQQYSADWAHEDGYPRHGASHAASHPPIQLEDGAAYYSNYGGDEVVLDTQQTLKCLVKDRSEGSADYSCAGDGLVVLMRQASCSAALRESLFTAISLHVHYSARRRLAMCTANEMPAACLESGQ